MADPRLGRVPSPDDSHLRKYGVRSAAQLPPQPMAVSWGINWYRRMSTPTQDAQGRWWICREKDWGPIDGGHCISSKPKRLIDPTWAAARLDQHQTPRCVGYNLTRAQTWYHPRTYMDPDWLYRQAQLVDSIPGTDYDGTEVRAGFDVLRRVGAMREDFSGGDLGVRSRLGIVANYWCPDVPTVRAVLGLAEGEPIPLYNSWLSAGYPVVVYLPDEGADRLLREDGEAGYVVPR